MNLKTLFGVNGVNGDKVSFSKWAPSTLKSLFPFSNNLYYDSEIAFNFIDDFKKFENSKILIIGGGPSTQEVKWENLNYDYIFTINHFYKNKNISNNKVDLISVGAEVDLQDEKFLEYVNKYNPILMFEWHPKWFNERNYFELLYKSYPKISCFQTRAYGKLGGAIRLLILALYLKAKEIYIVGSDGCPGLSVIEGKFKTPIHSFQSGKKNLPWKINESNAYEIYYHQHKTLWEYLVDDLPFHTPIYNLGEKCEYNFSSIWSKKIFPLPKTITNKIY
jgi:hypothetical protein